MFDNNITITGMVLSAMPVGEYDTRITILSKEKGKLSAFARGARKQGSVLMAGTRPFSFGTFAIYRGRNSNSVNAANITNYFAEITGDLQATYYGFYFLELTDYFTRENLDCTNVLKLLYQSLRALINPNIPDRLVKIIFELKLLVYNGEYPEMFRCVNCGETHNLNNFCVKDGGMLCDECSSSKSNVIGVKIDTSTIYAMQFVITAGVEKLYTFNVSKRVMDELENIMKRYMDRYVDKSFKSLEIINSLEYNTMD